MIERKPYLEDVKHSVENCKVCVIGMTRKKKIFHCQICLHAVKYMFINTKAKERAPMNEGQIILFSLRRSIVN